MRDVHMPTSEGVLLRIRVLGMLEMGKQVDVLTVYRAMVQYLRGGSPTGAPINLPTVVIDQ